MSVRCCHHTQEPRRQAAPRRQRRTQVRAQWNVGGWAGVRRGTRQVYRLCSRPTGHRNLREGIEASEKRGVGERARPPRRDEARARARERGGRCRRRGARDVPGRRGDGCPSLGGGGGVCVQRSDLDAGRGGAALGAVDARAHGQVLLAPQPVPPREVGARQRAQRELGDDAPVALLRRPARVDAQRRARRARVDREVARRRRVREEAARAVSLVVVDGPAFQQRHFRMRRAHAGEGVAVRRRALDALLGRPHGRSRRRPLLLLLAKLEHPLPVGFGPAAQVDVAARPVGEVRLALGGGREHEPQLARRLP
eukprot:3068978-Pleurochrysis_carterae.AAC.4